MEEEGISKTETGHSQQHSELQSAKEHYTVIPSSEMNKLSQEEIDRLRLQLAATNQRETRSSLEKDIHRPHHVILVCGSGDKTEEELYKFCTRYWQQAYGLTPHTIEMSWRKDRNDLQSKIYRIEDTINKYYSNSGDVSLISMSASGLSSLIATLDMPDKVHKLITLAARLDKGRAGFAKLVGYPDSTEIFPAQKEALGIVNERREEIKAIRSNILTIGSNYDGIIPVSASTLPEGPAIVTNDLFHTGAIAMPFMDSFRKSVPAVWGKQVDPSTNILTRFLTQ